MTVAVCIVCGAYKFGAFVPCKECGFEPTDLADKARSILLSEHNFPKEELDKFSTALRSHQTIPIDSITLAVVARPIAQEDYYWKNLDDLKGTLPCMQCGTEFRPDDDEVFCLLCRGHAEEPLSLCARCSLVFDGDAEYCQQCGAKLQTNTSISVKSLADDVGIGVGRTMENKDILAGSNFLGGVQVLLSGEQKQSTNRELKVFGLFCGLLVLPKSVPSASLRDRIQQELAGLYSETYRLRGADAKKTNAIRDLCLHRWHEYGAAMAGNPKQWDLFLANEATKHCFGIEKYMSAVTDMMVFIGYIIKVLQNCVSGSIKRASST